MAGACSWQRCCLDGVCLCLRPESQVPHLRWSQAPPLPWQRPGSADYGLMCVVLYYEIQFPNSLCFPCLFSRDVSGILDCFRDSSWNATSGTKPRFNDYVRGPLRQNLVTFLGTEEYISPKMCIVATLPIWFQSLICVLSCDGATCEKSAAAGGYTSVYQYTGWWFDFFFFFNPTYNDDPN